MKDVTMAMAQTLIKMKEQKSKEKGVAITDVEYSSRIVKSGRSITTLQSLPTIDPKDKGKGVLVKEEPVKIKMRDQGDLQVQADAKLAQRLHEEELAELERAQQERQRQEDDTNAALSKEFDKNQARIDADHELAVRLTHEEQEKYTIEERARLLAEFFDQRKKQLATARAKAIRNKPPTKTQVRNRMITYLKHMGKYTHQQLKNKTYEEIQRLYEKEKRWIGDFQPMDAEAIKDNEKKVDSSSKPVGGKEQESAKSDEETATDYEHEKEELRMWLTVISDEEETVDPKILSAKYPIVDWESQNLGNVNMEDLHVYKIIRVDGNTSYHKSLFSMLKKFDRQDLVDLHKLVMKRFEDTTPKGYNLLLWGDLKEMLQKMLNWKLEAEAESTMAFELLKFIKLKKIHFIGTSQLNLTKPGWDATCYEFKHDYTIIESTRPLVFPVNNNDRKIMRFNEIYKFSDGTLTRILEALDYIVKEFKVKRLNPGMNTRFWTEKDVTRSKEFIAEIERRLMTRRIYRNLECFISGRVRDIDYRLLQRME
ncbi:hypothetical protein Tco_1399856 [Tanacetum coccineum]